VKYPDRVRVYRQTGTAGTQDQDTGVFTPGAAPETTYYDGPADAQDMTAVVARDASGLPIQTADGTIFLRDERVLRYLAAGDLLAITLKDGTALGAEIAGIRRLDGAITFTWAH